VDLAYNLLFLVYLFFLFVHFLLTVFVAMAFMNGPFFSALFLSVPFPFTKENHASNRCPSDPARCFFSSTRYLIYLILAMVFITCWVLLFSCSLFFPSPAHTSHSSFNSLVNPVLGSRSQPDSPIIQTNSIHTTHLHHLFFFSSSIIIPTLFVMVNIFLFISRLA